MNPDKLDADGVGAGAEISDRAINGVAANIMAAASSHEAYLFKRPWL
jgi:hypothetical protein